MAGGAGPLLAVAGLLSSASPASSLAASLAAWPTGAELARRVLHRDAGSKYMTGAVSKEASYVDFVASKISEPPLEHHLRPLPGGPKKGQIES